MASLLLQIEESCSWLCALGWNSDDSDYRAWQSFSGLNRHLIQGKQLISRLVAICNSDCGKPSTTVARRLRSDKSGSIEDISKMCTIAMACRPLLEELRTQLQNSIPIISRSFTQANSAISGLVIKVQDLQ